MALLLTLLPLVMPTPAVARTGWSAWVTSPTDPSRRLMPVSSVAGVGSRAITIDPSAQYQTWLGVGASLTDASVVHLSGRTALQNLLFSPSAANGARLNLLRLPLSATDFSSRQWTWSWNGVEATPPPEAVAAADLAKALTSIQPNLHVAGVPWSAPAAMKTNGGLINGTLKPSSTTAYGNMLVSQVLWLQDRGVPLRYLTLGNEPALCTGTDYPTMCMGHEQMATIAEDVADGLVGRDVGLWAFDHNWEHRPRVDDVLHLAPDTFSAAAFHCYKGTPERMLAVQAPPIVTECTGTTDTWARTFSWDSRKLVVDSVNAGSTGLMMWNLALVDSGPHVGGCSDCRGILDGQDGATPAPGPEFYVLAHLARAASPGDRRIAVPDAGGLPAVAFARADGSAVGVYGHNDTGQTQNISVRVSGQQPVTVTVRAGELFTIRGPASGSNVVAKTLVRAPSGARFLIDPSGWRHRIGSDAVAACLGGDANLRDASDEEVDAYAEGEAAACDTAQPGDIIRHPDGDSYVLSGTASSPVRHWVPSVADFTCARAEANRRIVTVTRYQIAAIPKGADRPGGNCIIPRPRR